MCNDNNDFSGKDFFFSPLMVLILQRKNSFIHPAKSMVIHNVLDTLLGASNKTKSTPAWSVTPVDASRQRTITQFTESMRSGCAPWIKIKHKSGKIKGVQVWELASHSRQREQQVQRPWGGRVSGVYEEQPGDPSPPMPVVKCVRAMPGVSVCTRRSGISTEESNYTKQLVVYSKTGQHSGQQQIKSG